MTEAMAIAESFQLQFSLKNTMATEEVKLLGVWASPYAMRARIALNIKGVKYEYSEEVLANKSELLLTSNPVYKKVPVLIHDGKPICESMVIVQYVEEVWGASGTRIMPSDPYERAIARFWAAYVDDKLFPHVIGIMKAKTKEANSEAAEGAKQAASGLLLLEEFFEKSCKEKRFFGGDTIGYLDISLGSLLAWIKVAEVVASVKILDEARIPVLVQWAERFCMHDAVTGQMPEVNKLVGYFYKVLQAGWIKASSSN